MNSKIKRKGDIVNTNHFLQTIITRLEEYRLYDLVTFNEPNVQGKKKSMPEYE